ncbi:hypothetical protein [Nonomuraea sp. NPDC023979]
MTCNKLANALFMVLAVIGTIAVLATQADLTSWAAALTQSGVHIL